MQYKVQTNVSTHAHVQQSHEQRRKVCCSPVNKTLMRINDNRFSVGVQNIGFWKKINESYAL